MTARLALALLLLTGCAAGRSSYTAELSPAAYRAVKAATGAAATFGLERVGVPQPWATVLGVTGPVLIGKLARPQHEHPLGDWACDMVFSAAVVPLVVAKPRVGRWNVTAGLAVGAVWLGSALGIARECSP